jgi:hypothetical protein
MFREKLSETPAERVRFSEKLSETLRRWNKNSVAFFMSVTLHRQPQNGGDKQTHISKTKNKNDQNRIYQEDWRAT